MGGLREEQAGQEHGPEDGCSLGQRGSVRVEGDEKSCRGFNPRGAQGASWKLIPLRFLLVRVTSALLGAKRLPVQEGSTA